MPEKLSRREAGERIFELAKAEIEARGFALWDQNFPPDYPVSLRQLWLIRQGKFRTETVNRLPGVNVREWFEVEAE